MCRRVRGAHSRPRHRARPNRLLFLLILEV
jgi:hypothetical protein